MRHWLLSYGSDTRLMLWAPWVLFALAGALILTHLIDAKARTWTWKGLAAMAAVMLVILPYLALVWSPPEKYQGDVYRIFYAHVPQIWMAMIGATINFGASVAFLLKKSFKTDSLAEASAEVGLYFGTVGVVLGSIWAKPTWGTWWTWDPRLTSAAVMLIVYSGYLTMRRFVEDPEKRATWSSVMGIVAYVDIPVMFLAVRWWRSIHQVQSNPSTVDSTMGMVLLWSTTAFLCLFVVLMYQRFLLAEAVKRREVALPDALPPKEVTA
jgi:heme exporter protein C